MTEPRRCSACGSSNPKVCIGPCLDIWKRHAFHDKPTMDEMLLELANAGYRISGDGTGMALIITDTDYYRVGGPVSPQHLDMAVRSAYRMLQERRHA